MTAVLDHGSVLLVDHMASDQNVTGAARVSTGKGPGYTSKGPEADEKLIRYLMEHRHGTPFEHSVFQFFVKAPIFVFREWQRHRVGSFNEQSARYSELAPEFYVPDHIRVPDPANKQGAVRYEDHPDDGTGGGWGARIIDAIGHAAEADFDEYRRLLDQGVAREMARIVLPVSTYSSMWWTVNARSLMNFLMLRNNPAAQYEIRVYAEAIEAMFAEIMPMTRQAFVDRGRIAP